MKKIHWRNCLNFVEIFTAKICLEHIMTIILSFREKTLLVQTFDLKGENVCTSKIAKIF